MVSPTRAHLGIFNERVAAFRALPNPDDYVVLTPINQAADQTNRQFLDRLSGTPSTFEATVTGKFEPSAYPTDANAHAEGRL